MNIIKEGKDLSELMLYAQMKNGIHQPLVALSHILKELIV